jgi:MFS transporter, MHS family, proline/betaine transporter
MNSAPKGKMIAASMIGNVLEWYDFAIYGNFAAAIGRNFFPT